MEKLEQDIAQAGSFFDSILMINDYIYEQIPSAYPPEYSIVGDIKEKHIWITIEEKSYDGTPHKQSYMIGKKKDDNIYFFGIESSVENFLIYREKIKNDKNYSTKLLLNTYQFKAYKPYLCIFFIVMYISFSVYALWHNNIIPFILYSVFVHGSLFMPAYQIHNEANSDMPQRLFPKWSIILNAIFILVPMACWLFVDFSPRNRFSF